MSTESAVLWEMRDRLTGRENRAKRDLGRRQAIAFLSGLSFLEIDQRILAGEHSANMAPLAESLDGMAQQIADYDRRFLAYMEWRQRRAAQTGETYPAIDKLVNSGELIPTNKTEGQAIARKNTKGAK